MQKKSSNSFRSSGPGSKDRFKKDSGGERNAKPAKPFKKNYDGRGSSSSGDERSGSATSRPYGKDSKPYKKNYDGRGPSSGAASGTGSRSSRPYSGRVTDSDNRRPSDDLRGASGKPFAGKESRYGSKGDDTDRKPRKEFDKPRKEFGRPDKPFSERPKYQPSDRRDSSDKPAYSKDSNNNEEGFRKPRKEFDKSRSAGKNSRPFGDRPKRAPADRPGPGSERRGSFDKPAYKKDDNNKEEGSRKPYKESDKPRGAGKDSRPFRDRPAKPGAGKRDAAMQKDSDTPGFGKKEFTKTSKPEEARSFRNVMDDAFKQAKSLKKEDTAEEHPGKRQQFEDQVFGALEEESTNVPKPYEKKKVNKAFTKKKYIHDHSEGRKKKEDDEDDEDKDIDQKSGPRLEMPLNKFIAHSGECSRREAAELVRQGKVKVNGELVLDPGYRVKHDDKVTMSGKKLTPQKGMVYILLNKPKGFITTNDDPQGRRTVMELVGNAGVDRLFPVGRLDRNTSGLLLITNDGDLTQKLSHPAYEIKKVYQVTLDKPVTKADFEKIVEGVELEDGMAKVDALAYLEKKDELGLEIHSGRNRIVRRIFEALGYEVVKLDRVMYAGLTKKNLPRSKWRYLDEREVVLLKHFKS